MRALRLALLLAVLPVGARAQNFVLLGGVCILQDSTLDLLAVALVEPRPCRVIVYNPTQLDTLPPAVRLFVILHEAAHLALRHPGIDTTQTLERMVSQIIRHQVEADCMAARFMEKQWPGSTKGVLQWLRGPLGTVGIPAGHQRADAIGRCLQ